jgi:RNA polymerase sigma-70 factor (ECF subfamily)
MLTAVMSKAWSDAPPSLSPAPAQLSDQAEALQSVVRALIAHVLREPRSHPDVEDGVHEVFRRALEGGARVRPGEPIRPWVLGIARHVAIDSLRSRGRVAARQARAQRNETGELRDAVDGLADPGPGPDSVVERTDRARRIAEAMDKLPAEQRDALLRFHVEGLGYREIAAELGVPVGTVGTWINRGRRNLAAALEQDMSNDDR